MNVLEAIQRSSEFLARKGVDSPRLQIELLLAHVLQVPRLKLYLNFERVLAEPEVSSLRAMVQRRGQREPLQHILGSTSFCGYEMAVNRQVLVPRPETELLAEQAWQWLLGRRGEAFDRPLALDFGTGSGCLAIAIGLRCPAARVHAVDVSSEALAVARANAARHEVTERIQFFEGDGFAALPDGVVYDLVVSNPPYIPSGEIETLQAEVRDYDPRLALDGGRDGLVFYRRLARETGARLRQEGRLMMELGDGQEADVSGLFSEAGWKVESALKDYAGCPRILIASRAN